ncbi:MAG: asparagine synthase (glutamine-hydrolyzing), partial [Planctomycetota bacterium]
MCGIVGAYDYRTRQPVDPTRIDRMTDAVQHRGPDDAGVFSYDNVGLGHRRLSILGLGSQGKQPMWSADGRFCVVFNGEIYNYIELRRELEAAGLRLRSGTDTEVLLELYAREGARSLDRLRGMFAFAIWDREERVLFVARDRIGIKPVYWVDSSEGFAFASEVKALIAGGFGKSEVELREIDEYMRCGYVPGERSLFRGVRKLLPGHCLRVSESGIEVSKYWEVRYEPNAIRSEADTAEELRSLLLESSRLHMRSDVPVGVFLSGGLDSSAVVSLLADSGFSGVKTFSVAYDDGPDFDETAYAKLVADRFETDHHVLYVEPTEFAEFVPSYVRAMDEPV